jgi:hypothetical protein
LRSAACPHWSITAKTAAARCSSICELYGVGCSSEQSSGNSAWKRELALKRHTAIGQMQHAVPRTICKARRVFTESHSMVVINQPLRWSRMSARLNRELGASVPGTRRPVAAHLVFDVEGFKGSLLPSSCTEPPIPKVTKHVPFLVDIPKKHTSNCDSNTRIGTMAPRRRPHTSSERECSHDTPMTGM